MIHPPLVRACAAALAVLASAGCRDSPTDPSRPGTYAVTFIGMPADAESFSPRALDAGRVVGVAAGDGAAWAAEWSGGAFARIGPAAAAGCHTEPTAARGGRTVGQVICTATGMPAGQPVDAYGWAAGVAVPARLFPEPYTFVGVNADGTIAGTLEPAAQFPQGERRAFVLSGGGATVLVPPGATGSEAAGITDAGDVVVTAYFACAADAPDCAPSRAMAWRGGEWVELPVPRGAARTAAAAVSPAGHVASHAFGEFDRAFLYDLDRRDRDNLPVIPGTRVLLNDANVRGQVVGTGIRPDAVARRSSYGIVWGDDRQYPLSERLAGIERWEVTSADATDDEGRIAGTGLNPESGLEGAILLVPTSI